MPESARALISALLQKRPDLRPTGTGVKEHAFFTSTLRLDWDKLLRREIAPPVKPDVTTANFPAKHTKAPLESFIEREPKLPQKEMPDFEFHAAP